MGPVTDTDHSFYLLAGQVVYDSRPPVTQFGVVRQQTVHCHLGSDTDVTDGLVAVLPLGDVQHPLTTAQVFKEVTHLKSKF